MQNPHWVLCIFWGVNCLRHRSNAYAFHVFPRDPILSLPYYPAFSPRFWDLLGWSIMLRTHRKGRWRATWAEMPQAVRLVGTSLFNCSSTSSVRGTCMVYVYTFTDDRWSSLLGGRHGPVPRLLISIQLVFIYSTCMDVRSSRSFGVWIFGSFCGGKVGGGWWGRGLRGSLQSHLGSVVFIQFWMDR